MLATNRRIKFFGLTFSVLCKDYIKEALLSDSFVQVVTVNSEFIVECESNDKLKAIVNSSASTIDGQIPFWIVSAKYKGADIEKISGSDLILDVAKWAKQYSLSIFLLGGTEESNRLAVQNLNRGFDIDVGGYSPVKSDYPFDLALNVDIRAKLSEFRPDILFVGFGMGKQEYWIHDNASFLDTLGIRVAVGSGGTFEFISGHKSRAPKMISAIGLEGVYRFFVEPKLFRLRRLFKSLGVLKYIFVVMREQTNKN